MPPKTLSAARIGLALAACAALLLSFSTACSSPEQAGGNGETPPKLEPLSAVGDGEGELNIIAWAGYAEDGSNDPTRGLGDAVREADRMPDQRQARQHVRRDGAADANRPVRRRLGVRRRHAAADLRRRRGPGQHVAGAQLRGDLGLPQRQVVEFGGRADVRDSARMGRQPADVQHRGRPRRAELLGGRVRRRRQVQGQGHRLRLPHLHRRCRAVSVQDQAGTGHQGSRTR